MATQQRDKIEYDFEDLRRNEDPVDSAVLDQLGIDDEDLTEDERHDDTKVTDDREELDDKDGDTDDDLDEDGEYSPAKMTGAMRKRISGVKRDANRRIAAAKAEAGETISKLEKRVDELERAGKTDEVEAEYSGKISDLEEKIEAAMEAGDSKEVSRLTRELSDVSVDKRMAQRDLASSEEPDDLDEEDPPKIIPRATEWIQEQDWWDDEDLGHVRKFVRKADIALQKKGYKPTDDDFYEQLEALVEDKYPGIVEHTMSEEFEEEDPDLDLDEDEDEFADIPSKKSRRKAKAKKKRRRRSPVSEGDKGGVARAKKKRRSSNERKLTRARVANMRTFGMDPENPKDVEAYFENNPDIG